MYASKWIRSFWTWVLWSCIKLKALKAFEELKTISGQKPLTRKVKKTDAGFVKVRGARVLVVNVCAEFLINCSLHHSRTWLPWCSNETFDRSRPHTWCGKRAIDLPEINFDDVDKLGLEASIVTTPTHWRVTCIAYRPLECLCKNNRWLTNG